MKFGSNIYIEEWINDGLKICLDKYEIIHIHIQLKTNRQMSFYLIYLELCEKPGTLCAVTIGK
jgi:hypothetical protein